METVLINLLVLLVISAVPSQALPDAGFLSGWVPDNSHGAFLLETNRNEDLAQLRSGHERELALRLLSREVNPACDVVEIKHAPSYHNSLLLSDVFKVVMMPIKVEGGMEHIQNSEATILPPPNNFTRNLEIRTDFRPGHRIKHIHRNDNDNNNNNNGQSSSLVRRTCHGRYVYSNGREFLSYVPASVSDDGRDSWIIGDRPGVDSGFAYVLPNLLTLLASRSYLCGHSGQHIPS
jgi:hypothetical protein